MSSQVFASLSSSVGGAISDAGLEPSTQPTPSLTSSIAIVPLVQAVASLVKQKGKEKEEEEKEKEQKGKKKEKGKGQKGKKEKKRKRKVAANSLSMGTRSKKKSPSMGTRSKRRIID